MNINISKIVNSYALLSELDARSLPIMMAWWVSRNLKSISYHYNFFITERNKLYLEYCEADENNAYSKEVNGQILFNVKEGCQEVFAKKMNDLMNFEVALEPYLLDIEKIINEYPNIQIEPNFFNRLEYLLKE